MLDQTNRILNKIFENEKFIEIHTLHFKNFEKIFDETRSFVSVTSTRINIQQYNKTMKSLFFLVKNFEMQKQRCCVFIICSELVF